MSEIYPALATWFSREARDLPWRRPDFPAWGTLLSEVMLQQTQAARVAAEIEGWLETWPTPESFAAAPTSEVLRRWGNLGYPRRAVRLQQAAKAIVEEHGGEVPSELDALLALPGVGDYTARAVAVFHFQQRQPVVDTNVRRVVARFLHGLANQGHPRKKDLADVEALLPEEPKDAALLSAALMELGALVCTSRSPACSSCPLLDSCAWVRAGRPDNAPSRRTAQPRFEGSDRQARGRIMARLRASDHAVPRTDLRFVWEPDEQRERAIAGLIDDGLAAEEGGSLRLP